MKIKVLIQTEMEFDVEDKIELPPQDPKGHDSEMLEYLKQGKRCLITCRSYQNKIENFLAGDLKIGDQLFWVDGDSWERSIGEIVKIETT